MSAVNVPQHRCSCGRTFLNGISLERHQWVTKHATAEAIAPVANQQAQAQAQAAMAEAMRVLKEKQALQQQFDHKRRQKRRLRRQLMHVEQGVEQLVEFVFANVRNLGQSVMLAGRVVVLLGVISSLVAAGMKIGTYFPG